MAEDRIDSAIQKRTAQPLETIPDAHFAPHSKIPNTPLATSTLSFLLGSVFSLGAATFLAGGFQSLWWTTYQLGFFIAAWSAFHWGEFAVTAGWNRHKCSVDSFLLENGMTYHAANASAVTEYLITLYFKPEWKAYPYVSVAGVCIALAGQALRSIAMIHASDNFSHIIEYRKRNAHVLITKGIYAWFRHPSYAGFYYWALGTQLVLQNPFNFCVYSVLLWKFFYHRTRSEEKLLVKFFGDEYISYRSRVRTWIPFVP